MDDVQTINDELEVFPRQIFEAAKKTEDLREVWMLAEARKDYESAGVFLKAKAANLTEGQAKAKAIEAVYKTSMEVVRAESAFRRTMADQTRLENEFTSVRKRANLIETMMQHTGRD